MHEPGAGPGLLIVEGQQHPFHIEGVWRSEVPATPGLTIEVDFDPEGRITSITAISETQLAKEQAAVAGAQVRDAWRKLAAVVGWANLAGAGVLLMGWFFLPALSIQPPFLGKLQFSFWELLGLLNANNPLEALAQRGGTGSGFYGFLAIVALTGPFISLFWKDRRATLAGVLPLVFMLVVGLMVRSSLMGAYGGNVDGPLREIATQAREVGMQAVTIGFGSYLSLLVSAYFATVGTRRFLAAAGTPAATEKPRKAMA